MSAVRNVGASRIIYHRSRLAIGRPSDHPFGTPGDVEYVVHYVCADFLAEGMGTLAVFGELHAQTQARVRKHQAHRKRHIYVHKHRRMHARPHTYVHALIAHAQDSSQWRL
jgi:hypothetical protein